MTPGETQWLMVALGAVLGWLARWTWEARDSDRRHRRVVGQRSVYLDDFDRRHGL